MPAVDDSISRSILWLGFWASSLIVVFECAYAVVLFLGLSALATASEPIGDPFFTAMELLIIAMMPAFIILTIAIHAICASYRRHFATAAIVFGTLLSGLTTSVHTAILMLSREPAFVGMSHVFSFEWPSVVYVLDVLAWDFFFGFFAIFLALSFERRGLHGWIRRILLLSGILTFVGLLGAANGDMSIRNIGIIGYVGAFPIAAVLIGISMSRQLRVTK
jgi:hypothetical protein